MILKQEDIEELLRDCELPDGVRGYKVELGEDSTGDPALWVVFEIDDDLAPNKRKLKALTNLERSVRKQILETFGSERWPYVQFKVAA